jgi:hypothetical protein
MVRYSRSRSGACFGDKWVESNELNEKLHALFEAVNAKVSRRGIDFLGAVIADAKRKF